MPNNSTSSALERQPRLIRNIAASLSPIASATCEARGLPEEQAEPDDAATPSRSSAIANVCAAIPGAEKALVLGRRGALIPRNRASRQYRRDPPLGVVPKSGEPAGLVQLASRGLESGRETNRRRDIFGPGAATAFLPAATQDRLIYMETLPGEGQSPGADRPAELMRGKQQNIRAQCRECCIATPHRLGRVADQQPASRVDQRSPPRRRAE